MHNTINLHTPFGNIVIGPKFTNFAYRGTVSTVKTEDLQSSALSLPKLSAHLQKQLVINAGLANLMIQSVNDELLRLDSQQRRICDCESCAKEAK